MRYLWVDELLKGICSEMGDDAAHRYADFYRLFYDWLYQVYDQRLGGYTETLVVPVSGRRAFIPPGMEVRKVGVNVNGSLSVLLPNDNMLDLPDDCGGLEAPRSGNPDAPSFNFGGADLRVGGFWGFPFTDFPLTTASYTMTGYWPGQGGGKSIRGYYRVFPERGYILLDDTFRMRHVILEGSIPSFRPGIRTYINEAASEAITAYLVYKSGHIRSQVLTMPRPMLQYNQQDYVRTMKNLRSALNGEPLHVLIAAAQSGIGQTDIF